MRPAFAPFVVARALATGLLALSAAATAARADTVTCTADTGRFALTASLESDHGPDAGDGALSGMVRLKGRDIPADLAHLPLERAALLRSWLLDGQINLHLRQPRAAGQPEGAIEIILLTRKSDNDPDYTGRFRMKATYRKKPGDAAPVAFEVTGWAKCHAE